MTRDLTFSLVVAVAFSLSSHVHCSHIVDGQAGTGNDIHVHSQDSMSQGKLNLRPYSTGWTVEEGGSHRHLRDRRSFDLTDERENCTDISNPPLKYNDSCAFVKLECEDKHELIDYLEIAVCHIGLDLKVKDSYGGTRSSLFCCSTT